MADTKNRFKTLFTHIRRGMFIVIVLVLCFTMSNGIIIAKANIEKSLSEFLSARGIHYNSILLKEKVLTVDLLSAGTGRCTLDDVKAIQAIYSAAHGKGIINNVDNIQINIYNDAGKLIYDYYEADVSAKLEGRDGFSKIDNVEPDISPGEITEDVRQIAELHSFAVTNIEVLQADGILGRRVDVVLQSVKHHDDVTLSDLYLLYEEICRNSERTGIVSQCSLSLMDEMGECLLYMTGDFQYGHSVTWVSPVMEESVINHEGPQREATD